VEYDPRDRDIQPYQPFQLFKFDLKYGTLSGEIIMSSSSEYSPFARCFFMLIQVKTLQSYWKCVYG